MTLLRRSLVVLLLLLNTSSFFHSRLLTRAASTSRNVTYPPIQLIPDLNSNDDYDEDKDEDTNIDVPVVKATARTTFRKMSFCPFDPCSEDHMSCEDLERLTGCLCPGVSGAGIPPQPPRIRMLLPVSEGEHRGKVEVQWCAPSSVVSGYRVTIEGNEGDALEFQAGSRKAFVRSLEAGTKVCVEAVNTAGHSSPSDFSCKRYDIPESSDHKLLAGVIGGGVALLLILIIGAVILWRYRLFRKAKRDSADGLGNPSYSKEGTL